MRFIHKKLLRNEMAAESIIRDMQYIIIFQTNSQIEVQWIKIIKTELIEDSFPGKAAKFLSSSKQ